MVDQDTVFNEIYDSTNKAVLSFITAKCGNTADIHDIFQETYMEFYKLLNKRGVDYITNGKALIMRIARQKLARHYSLLDRLRLFVSLTKSIDGDYDDSIESEADSFNLEEFVVNQLMLEKAVAHIEAKPNDIQKIFYLYYFSGTGGFTLAEIAKELKMSESNVKQKLYRTIKEIREIFN